MKTKVGEIAKRRTENAYNAVEAFQLGLGTVPGVYEATTIAHRWLHFGQISRLPTL